MNQPGANGQHVVEATISHVENRLNITTNRMLLRMALIESEFGTNPQTFNNNFIDHTGLHSIGIWQITNMALAETKTNLNLQVHRNQIQQVFGIDWKNVSMDDMKKPLHCCLAVYLYIKFAELAWPNAAAVGWPLSYDLQGQAKKWKHHFNRNDRGLSIDGFVQRCNQVGV